MAPPRQKVELDLAAVRRGLESGPRRDGAAAQGPDVAQSSTSGPPGMGPGALKTRESGGQLVADLQHPSISTVEIYETILPQSGMFDPAIGTANRNFGFEIATYKVARGQTLWLYDYEFWVNDFSGVDPAQPVRAEPGRYLGNIGFDVNVNGGRRYSTLRYVLDPRPVTLTKTQFDSGRSTPTSIVQARSAASAGGAGTSLLPLRPEVQGARDKPFTMIVDEGDTVVLAATVFRAFTTPIASVVGRFGGYLLPSQVSAALITRSRPQ